MITKCFTGDMAQAAEILRAGGLVAVPTETVYGLAGNGLDAAAVEKIYEVKGRPAVKPLSLMVHDSGAIGDYCEDVPAGAYKLAEKFWPGPLTIVLKARDIVPEIVRAGGETLGLRCPDHKMTLDLLRAAKIPFAAPSANPSGEESPKNAEKVREYFDGRIDGIVDGGQCGIGLESTIIDMSQTPYKILRHGALPQEDIQSTLIENMQIIGITGGTGCGKTTALNCLAHRGALIIDCDALYHEMLKTDGEMLAEIDKYFPGAITDGVLDTKALGVVVFNDRQALDDLNLITHKHIDRRVDELLAQHAMAGGALAAIDAIALIESGVSRKCDVVIGVIADYDMRVERIMKRDGISREYALARVNSQQCDEFYRENCGYILENSHGESEFKDKCEKLFSEVVK